MYKTPSSSKRAYQCKVDKDSNQDLTVDAQNDIRTSVRVAVRLKGNRFLQLPLKHQSQAMAMLSGLALPERASLC